MIPYKYLSLKKETPAHKGAYWDFALLDDLLTDPRFKEVDTLDNGGIIIFPARAQADKVSELNKYIKPLKWCVLLLTGDEESDFPVEKISHPNISIYVMSPKQGRHDKYNFLPNGYTPHTRPNLKLADKNLDWIFAGQNTHPRRSECIDQLSRLENGKLIATKGFTQGLPPEEYIHELCNAKIAPCPSGPVTSDTFRLYEALEAGCIPIADSESKTGTDYWNYLFDNPPFPTIKNYQDLPGYIEDQLDNFQARANKIQAWWIKQKRDLKHKLIQDVADLTGKHHKEAITVVIPVSPIKSHPSTEILEKCIDSIRHHLSCEIIITFDGVSKHDEHKRKNYEEFTRRALFLCNTKWNAIPVIFDEHTHQVGMARKVLEFVDTPTILYVEGDTGLVLDYKIDFKYLVDKILDGTSNLIRLHFEGVIPKDHEHMMLGTKDDLIKTYQWSQRPHLASTAYYRRILKDYFSENAFCMIEDQMHSIVSEAYILDGETGWQQHRLHIYAPNNHIKFSVDFNGRDGEKKWDEEYRF